MRRNLAKEVSAPAETAALLQAYPYKLRRNTGIQHPVRHNNLFVVLKLVQVFIFMLWNCYNCSFGCQGLVFWFVPCSHLECLILDLPIISLVKQIRAPPGPELVHGVPQFKLLTLGALTRVLEAAQPPGRAENCCSFTSGKLQCNSKPSQGFRVRL